MRVQSLPNFDVVGHSSTVLWAKPVISFIFSFVCFDVGSNSALIVISETPGLPVP